MRAAIPASTAALRRSLSATGWHVVRRSRHYTAMHPHQPHRRLTWGYSVSPDNMRRLAAQRRRIEKGAA